MKRLIAFLFLCAGLLGLSQKTEFDLLSFSLIESVTYVTDAKVGEGEFVQNGNDFYYKFDLQSAKEQLQGFHDAKAIILDIQNSSLTEVEKFYKIDTFSKYEVGNLIVFEGYTNLYKNYKMIQNKKVNVQIAVKDGGVTLGFPMILTGF